MKLVLALVIAVVGASVAVVTEQSAGSVEKELIGLEDRWAQALIHHDSAALDTILDDTFISTDESGHQEDKAQNIAVAKSPSLNIESAVSKDVRVRVYGDAAVLTAIGEMKGTNNGKPLTSRFRVTDTFVRQNGIWRVVASHNSELK
jgi:ketosteroid isomerase-like protein